MTASKYPTGQPANAIRSRVYAPCQDGMVAYLIKHFGYTPERAAAAVEHLPEQLITGVMKRHPGMLESLAEIAVDQTFGFHLVCRDGGLGAYVPSELVDEIWEHFMTISHLYWAFCDVFFGPGVYVHHVPNDLVGFDVVEDTTAEASLLRTTDALVRLGVPFDQRAWKVTGGCTNHQCIADSEEKKRRRMPAA